MAKAIQQMRHIEAPSTEDFVILFNETMAELADCNPKAINIEGKSAIILYDETVKDSRHCCECGLYEWGEGCAHREGLVRLMDKACINFTIEVAV